MRVVCPNHPPEAIQMILDCLGLPSRPPLMAYTLPDRYIGELYILSNLTNQSVAM